MTAYLEEVTTKLLCEYCEREPATVCLHILESDREIFAGVFCRHHGKVLLRTQKKRERKAGTRR